MVSVTIPSSAVLQNPVIGLRMLPLSEKIVKFVSRKCLSLFEGLKYAQEHRSASGENMYNNPRDTASFPNPSPFDAIASKRLVIYGACNKDKVLTKIGQTTHLAERKKANKYVNHDLVCLIYLEGIPLHFFRSP